MDNPTGLDFIPAGAITGKKEIGRKRRPGGNKSRQAEVYTDEHVHTRRGLVPLSLQARAILPAEGKNVRGVNIRDRDSRGEKR